jgi:hypothetical protein
MKICSSAYGDKVPPKELGSYFSYFSPTAEDEDVCPTCLEGIITLLVTPSVLKYMTFRTSKLVHF